jgi:2'-5' RNA ligase
LKKALVELQDELASGFHRLERVPDFKPERLVNSHCTLRFLGNIEESKVQEIAIAAGEAIRNGNFPRFECSLGKCGVFPNRRHARVMWIALKPEEPFHHIQKAIDSSLESAGVIFEHDHPFHPHLTLFRFRTPYRIPPDFIFPDLTATSPAALVTEVALMESKTFAEGPEHIVRAKFGLS